MKIVLVEPRAERRDALGEGLRSLGHVVEAFVDARAALLPAGELAIVGGRDPVEACALLRRGGQVRWILALAGERSRAALEAGAHDCVAESASLADIALRIDVAAHHGWFAPAVPVALGPEGDVLDGLLPQVSGRQLRVILDLLPTPTGMLDASGRFVQCNVELERTFGAPAGSVPGRHIGEFFTADDVEAILAAILREGRVRDQELHTVDHEGHAYWVAGQARWIPHGQTGFVLGSFADITERKLTEEALRQSEASLRSVLYASPDGIIVHSKGRYLFVNPAAVRQLGFTSPDELMHTSIFERVHPDEYAAVRERINAMVASGRPATPLDIQFLRADGEVFIGEVASIPATFDGQAAIISIIRDVGEQRRLQSQLYLADRLATVGTLAVGVAHEINNPLSWVMGNLGLLADEFDRQVALREQDPIDPAAVVRSRARVRELLGRAQEGTERVRRIVRDLGRFARSDEGGDGTTDIHALLDSTLEIADVQIRHRARLIRDFQARARARGSEARLGQVFLNLLVNAGQAIAPGSTRDNHIRVATRDLVDERGEWVEITISDTGCGIPERIRARIFDPFFTTKPVGEGTGIGLAISHSIVSAVGGRMEVESVEGKGSTFRVVLAAAQGDDPSQSAPVVRERSEASPPVAKARVLVIDDEPLIREMVCDALADHQVEAVSSGREALPRIVEEDWDLILCDLIMPEVSGVEVWERLGQLRPDARRQLVFMTGGDFSGKAANFMDSVSVRRLEKPFSIKALRALVRKAMRKP
ncbi:PAS domain S-box protein [Nannocystaceae bacterium ST9]